MHSWNAPSASAVPPSRSDDATASSSCPSASNEDWAAAITEGKLQPFKCPIVGQDGKEVECKGGTHLDDGQVLGMNFYVKGIDEKIPGSKAGLIERRTSRATTPGPFIVSACVPPDAAQHASFGVVRCRSGVHRFLTQMGPGSADSVTRCTASGTRELTPRASRAQRRCDGGSGRVHRDRGSHRPLPPSCRRPSPDRPDAHRIVPVRPADRHGRRNAVRRA